MQGAFPAIFRAAAYRIDAHLMDGMIDTAGRESRERIKPALMNVRKEGAGFDLPMALGIPGAMGVVRGTDRCRTSAKGSVSTGLSGRPYRFGRGAILVFVSTE